MRRTDYVILGLLSESPMNGYQIKQIIDVRFRFFWSESYGQLYTTLKSLCSDGWIEEIETGAVHNRSQKTYQLKREGFDALKHWLQQPSERESVRLEILLKMYFSHLVEEDIMIRHILSFQQTHEQDLHMLKMFEKELRSIIDEDPNHPYVLRVIDFGQKVNEAYLQWSRETIEFLERRSTK